eukprot:jgi/Botrbrau1/17346/Bobra.0015s0091.1
MVFNEGSGAPDRRSPFDHHKKHGSWHLQGRTEGLLEPSVEHGWSCEHGKQQEGEHGNCPGSSHGKDENACGEAGHRVWERRGELAFLYVPKVWSNRESSEYTDVQDLNVRAQGVLNVCEVRVVPLGFKTILTDWVKGAAHQQFQLLSGRQALLNIVSGRAIHWGWPRWAQGDLVSPPLVPGFTH